MPLRKLINIFLLRFIIIATIFILMMLKYSIFSVWMRHLTIEPNFQKECLEQQNISQRGSMMTLMTMLPFPFLHHTQHGVSWRNLHASNVIFEHHFHFFILHHFHFKNSFHVDFSKFTFCMLLHFTYNFLLWLFNFTFFVHLGY